MIDFGPIKTDTKIKLARYGLMAAAGATAAFACPLLAMSLVMTHFPPLAILALPLAFTTLGGVATAATSIIGLGETFIDDLKNQGDKGYGR